VTAVLAQAGATIEIPTGSVVVDIYARSPRLALAAAQTVVPINGVGEPAGRLPGRLPDSGFADRPLAAQVPRNLRSLLTR
jgi:hypothetical protein